MPSPLDFLNPIKGIATVAEGIIDQFVDSPEEKAQAKAMLMKQQAEMMEERTKAEMARAETVRAEIKGQSWLQRNWRPISAMTFVFIVANNYIIAPYVSAFGGSVPTLDIPEPMWFLLTTMIGGYTMARSWEKKNGAADNRIPSITDKVLDRIGDATSQPTE